MDITIGFSTIKNGGRGPMVVIQLVEGRGCGRNGDLGSSSSLSGMTMSGDEIGLIVMIPHVENGGCMEVGAIQGLGRAVGTDVGIRQRWQQWHRRCSCNRCLGLVQCVHRRVIDTQSCIGVAVAIGCWCPNPHPTLPFIPFHPIAHPTFLLPEP